MPRSPGSRMKEFRISAIFRKLQEERFSNPDAATVLMRLESSIGMAPSTPSLGVNRITNAKPDEASFGADHWADAELAPKLGYKADFLSTELPLAKIVGKRNGAKAARLDGGDNFILDYLHFSSVIHKERRFPMLTAVNIHGELLKHPGERSAGWRRDKRLPDDFQSDENFYRHKEGSDLVHFSRGHLVRRLDPCWGTEEEAKLAELHTFHYTNAAPQVQHYNDVECGNLEDYLLDRAQTVEQKMTVFTGPVFRSSDPQFRKATDKTKSWQIPVSFWKVAVLQKFPRDIAVAAFVIGQLDYLRPLYEKRVFSKLTPYSDAELQSPKIQTTVEVIEALTGFNFAALRMADKFASLPEFDLSRYTLHHKRIGHRHLTDVPDWIYPYTTSRSLASIWSPACTSTSAIVPSRSACSAVSIFIASIDSSTSPALTVWPAATATRRDDARHRRADMRVVARLGLAPQLRGGVAAAAVRHLDAARLAVELEEHA